jgi:hypothetical protein
MGRVADPRVHVGTTARYARTHGLIDARQKRRLDRAATRVDGRPHVFAVEEGLDWLVDQPRIADALQQFMAAATRR